MAYIDKSFARINMKIDSITASNPHMRVTKKLFFIHKGECVHFTIFP